MPRFRASPMPHPTGDATDLLAVGEMIDDAMRPGNFFVHAEIRLDFLAAQAETIPWEIYHGRLLDAGQTRLTKTLLSWRAILAEETHTPGEPLIAVRLDVHARQIHVTRGMLAYVWEGYDVGDGVIESRETIKWTRELVGTISLAEFADLDSLRDELICTIWQAVVGTSRLPLHSVEAPLPACVFGQLHYVYREHSGEQPCLAWREFLTNALQTPLAWRELVKLLEFTLRHVTRGDIAEVAHAFMSVPSAPTQDWARLMRTLFNEVSLSPHTGLIDNALALVDEWVKQGVLRVEAQIDFLSWLLRQLVRHLTAYDLVTFHHRGANYPDALLLDAALKALLRCLEAQPHWFENEDARLWRRALRHGCLLRRHYEGLRVPSQPTSPGENARVMPAHHPRLSEEEILQPLKRRRQLFENDPLSELLSPHARRVFAQSMRDLEQLAERIELGVGLFIDRPLGYAKAPIEPDLTPILAHEAFSPSLEKRRIAELSQLAAELGSPPLPMNSEGEENARGLPHRDLAECPRPVAALADVRKVADDFVITSTLPGGMNELLRCFDWQELLARFRLRFLADAQVRLCVQLSSAIGPVLALFDDRMRRRVEMRVDASEGYARRAGLELPRAGLHVLRVWEDTDDRDVIAEASVEMRIREVMVS